jgi:hypothetical protein
VTIPIRAGQHVLGVRANSSMTGELVARALTDRIVVGAAPPGNMSIALAQIVPAGPQELHRVYVNHRRMVRTRSVRRALSALWHYVDAHDRRAPRDEVQVLATVLLKGNDAHVMPADVRSQIIDMERQWNREGYVVVDRATLELDLDTATVRVPECQLPWSSDTDDLLASWRVLDRPNSLIAEPGAYPIASWTAATTTRSLAARVVSAGGQVADLPLHDGSRLLERLAAVLRHIPQGSTSAFEPVVFQAELAKWVGDDP